MRSILILAAALVFAPIAADAAQPTIPPVTYPELETVVPAPKEIIPKGWRLETSAKGVLNGDDRADMVLVLRDDDAANVVKRNGDEVDTNPRMLAVLVATENGLRLAAANHGLVPRHENPAMSDPLDAPTTGGIAIEDGKLRITLGEFYSMGSWEMGSSTFTFRWQDERMVLIGFDDMSTQRNTGETVETSVNFLTGKTERTTGRIDSDETKTETRDLPRRRLLALEEVGDGFAFDPAARRPLPSISDTPGWNWASAAESADHAEYRDTRRICERLKDREPTEADWPSADDAKHLKGCDSYALYYGIGVARDPAAAKACAFLETLKPDGGENPFAGTGILMSIYANGRGGKRDLDLAISLACRIEGAPYGTDARIDHLQAMKVGKDKQEFDYCDDATSSYATSLCSMKTAGLEGEKRQARIDALTKSWSAADHAAFSPLRDAAENFASVSGDNEVDLSGTGRASFVIERQEQVHDQFVAMLAKLEKRSLPKAGKADAKAADGRLNRLYKKIMATKTTPDDMASFQTEDSLPDMTVTHEGIRKAQRAWLAYRDAWTSFAAVKFFQTERSNLLAALTRERIDYLNGFVGAP